VRAGEVIDRGSRLRLARQVRLKADPLSGKHLLLYPERGLELNETAARAAALCTEEITVAEILDRVAEGAAAGTPRERIDGEVLEFLQALEARGLLAVDGA
jgi:pyrroloquinoline quinone biosynthesis protein D